MMREISKKIPSCLAVPAKELRLLDFSAADTPQLGIKLRRVVPFRCGESNHRKIGSKFELFKK
jgi:hypothetical protein